MQKKVSKKKKHKFAIKIIFFSGENELAKDENANDEEGYNHLDDDQELIAESSTFFGENDIEDET